jgi:hypothetical protein
MIWVHETDFLPKQNNQPGMNMFDLRNTCLARSARIWFAVIVCSLIACDSNPKKTENSTKAKTPAIPENQPAPGFDLAGSDARAVALADAVMEACGGRENWEKTRIVAWDWFGKRLNVWNKWSGDIRVESRRSLILMNLNARKGRAWKDGHAITEPEALQRAMDYGYEAWANDSYWMFLPFKLKDGGVTLKYIGEDTTSDGRAAEVIGLTFNGVGLTPKNKHVVYIDKKSKLLVQWDFYRDAEDPAPHFFVPWRNYRKFGNILLSDDRGEGPRRKHVGLGVFDELPAAVFNSPDPIDWEKIRSELAHHHNMENLN